MARAVLNDSGGVLAVGGSFFGSVPARLDDDCCVPLSGIGKPGGPGPVDPPVEAFPKVSVRGRSLTGYSEDGNQLWEWATLVEDAASIRYEKREEWDDAAGITLVNATVTFLYADHLPMIPETAVARTDDGVVWRVTKSERSPGRMTLTLKNVENVEPSEPVEPGVTIPGAGTFPGEGLFPGGGVDD